MKLGADKARKLFGAFDKVTKSMSTSVSKLLFRKASRAMWLARCTQYALHATHLRKDHNNTDDFVEFCHVIFPDIDEHELLEVRRLGSPAQHPNP